MASPEIQPPAISKSGCVTDRTQRKVAIAVDLSDHSAYAVEWAVQNHLRRDDTVILLHVRPNSVLYGVVDAESSNTPTDGESKQKLESDFDAFTATKANNLAKPLVDSHINFKIHIVKDNNMKERLCLEVEKLGLGTVIMGSRGFGASRRSSKGQRLGSVSDYCVHHCVCPVVVVRFPGGGEAVVGSPLRVSDKNGGIDGLLQPAPEEEPGFHDASDKQTDYSMKSLEFNQAVDFDAKSNHCQPSAKRSKTTSSADPQSQGSVACCNISSVNTTNEEGGDRDVREPLQCPIDGNASKNVKYTRRVNYETFEKMVHKLEELIDISQKRMEQTERNLQLKESKQKMADLQFLSKETRYLSGLEKALAERIKQRIRERYNL